MITRYGYDVVGVVFLVVLTGSLLSWYLVNGVVIKALIIALLILILLFTLYFFRDPDRTTPAGKDLVISPADGEVVLVKEVREDVFLKGEGVQVSIFMSP